MTEWNQTAVYKCNDGYSLSNKYDYKKYCGSNGLWEGKLGKCIPSKTD